LLAGRSDSERKDASMSKGKLLYVVSAVSAFLAVLRGGFVDGG
jgi:hypothetical protein